MTDKEQGEDVEAINIQWYINHIEDYLGGNVIDCKPIDYMSLTRFLRATLEQFRAAIKAEKGRGA